MREIILLLIYIQNKVYTLKKNTFIISKQCHIFLMF
jgi:hypothetical protein